MRELIALGVLYRASGVINGGDSGGDFFRTAVLCLFPLFFSGDMSRWTVAYCR